MTDFHREMIERLTRERDEARSLASINESGADQVLNMLDAIRAEAAERKLAMAREELRSIRFLIGYSGQDIVSISVAESNKNKAWQIADKTLAALEAKDGEKP